MRRKQNVQMAKLEWFSPKEFVRHQSFVHAAHSLRELSSNPKLFYRVAKALCEMKEVQMVPVGFFGRQPFVLFAFCFDQTRAAIGDTWHRLNLGFWVHYEGEEVRKLPTNAFHVVWTPAGAFEAMRHPSEMHFYEDGVLSLDEIVSRADPERGVYANPDLPRIAGICI